MQMTYLDSKDGNAVKNAGVSAASVSILLSNRDAESRAREVYQANVQRLDALAPGHGIHLARELEFSYQRVLETVYTDLKALTLFPVDSTVPKGALQYRITSEDMTGSAKYHRGEGYSAPRVGLTRNEELRPVRHIINGFELDTFELAASNYAGTDIRGRMERAAKRAMSEFLDAKTWLGSGPDDVYGVINYPYVPKTASSVSISGASTPAQILAELNRLAKQQFVNTDEKFSPNTLAMPTRQREYIRQTQMDLSGTLQTIEQAFLRDNGHIDKIESVPLLAGAGPGSEDILLFFKREDQDSIANVIPENFSMLPAETQGFSIFVPCYMSHGGVRMWYPLNNMVCYSPAVTA
jgi:hypothetical protein